MATKHFCDRCGDECGRKYCMVDESIKQPLVGWARRNVEWDGHFCKPCLQAVLAFVKGDSDD